MTGKLVMTLLVRDEEDILESNICFHLNQGVDYIVATDNGSVDGTIDILEKYFKKGVLNYSIKRDNTYEQAKWVSEMAFKSVNEYGAVHMFHCDADEFWTPVTGQNLSRIAENITDISGVKLFNYLPPQNTKINGFDFSKFTHLVANPLPYPKKSNRLESSKILLYKYPMKIITSNKYTTVGYGNHCTDTVTNDELKVNENIVIHHFSIRNYDHFEKKVINGGVAYLNNPDKIKGLGWHWKRWYELYLDGKLKDEYKKISNYRDLNIVKKVTVPWPIKNATGIYRFSRLFSRRS